MRRHTQNRAFTLVEMLIVVIIMGVLATIIIGLYTNTTKDAGVNALRDNLRAMRGALQVYLAEHGRYPTVSSFGAQMTQFTDTDGNTSATKDSTYRYGPYILTMPTLPVGANKGQTAVTGAGYADGFGWQFDVTTGDFRANCQPTESDDQGNFYYTF